MHIDNWVRASVLVAVVARVPGWISMFRPSTVVIQQPNVTHAQPQPAISDKADDPPMNRTQLFFEIMRYVGPILSGAFIALAVFLAVRKPPPASVQKVAFTPQPVPLPTPSKLVI